VDFFGARGGGGLLFPNLKTHAEISLTLAEISFAHANKHRKRPNFVASLTRVALRPTFSKRSLKRIVLISAVAGFCLKTVIPNVIDEITGMCYWPYGPPTLRKGNRFFSQKLFFFEIVPEKDFLF